MPRNFRLPAVLSAVAGSALLPACSTSTPNWTMSATGTPGVAAPSVAPLAPAPATAPALAAADFDPPAAATPAAANLNSVASDSGPTSVDFAAGVSRITFAEEGADFDPCTSRDGSLLVFASTQHRATADIYLKRTDSRTVTQLTNDGAEDAMPTISPDGSKVAFASNRTGNWDIYIMPISGGRAVQVTSDLADDVHPSWSPDGRQLVFSRRGQGTGRWEMWTTDIANPAVASFIGFGVLPQWCPVAGCGHDGADRILFQLGRERGNRTFSLWTLDLANSSAGNLTEVASSTTNALISPAWSPDGQWIAYTEVPADTSTANHARPAWASLWMISAEGEGRVRLTANSGVSLSPAWAGNNRLFFVSNRAGADNIWSLDITPALRAAQATRPGTTHPANPATTPVVAHAAQPLPTSAAPAHAEPAPVATAPEGDSDHH